MARSFVMYVAYAQAPGVRTGYLGRIIILPATSMRV